MSDVLDPAALHAALDQLSGWAGSMEEGLSKTYDRGDFPGAMDFVNRVAEIAERMDHHPDIQISWATVALRIISHSAGGVTDACVELARAIDAEAA
jgi:4a-hydroxytetrahydrobiopterin dehydratase